MRGQDAGMSRAVVAAVADDVAAGEHLRMAGAMARPVHPDDAAIAPQKVGNQAQVDRLAHRLDDDIARLDEVGARDEGWLPAAALVRRAKRRFHELDAGYAVLAIGQNA